jgi:GTP-binding protein
LVPATSENAGKEYRTLLNELELYDPTLLDKERLLAISKGDLIDEEAKVELLKTLPADIPYVFTSSVTQEGISEMKDLIWKTLNP